MERVCGMLPHDMITGKEIRHGGKAIIFKIAPKDPLGKLNWTKEKPVKKSKPGKTG